MTMADTTTVVMIGNTYDATSGDTVEVSTEQAERLIANGHARAPYAEGSKSDTVESILAAVGEDKDKAQAALDAEQAKGSPRVTLVGKLEAIAGA